MSPEAFAARGKRDRAAIREFIPVCIECNGDRIEIVRDKEGNAIAHHCKSCGFNNRRT